MVDHPLSRPFGHAAPDLDIDFGATDRPALVTALLASCAAPADADHWWSRPVGERTEALLALLRAIDGAGRIALTLPCTSADCGERFEIVLPDEAFDTNTAATDTVAVPRADAEPLLLRRPDGNDLRAWSGAGWASRAEAEARVLASLRIAGEVRPGDAASAAQALAEADPLVAFSIACACPACGAEAEHAVDLDDLALRRLALRQRALLREVHALASAYGWSEADILVLAPARRARYLALIEGVA